MSVDRGVDLPPIHPIIRTALAAAKKQSQNQRLPYSKELVASKIIESDPCIEGLFAHHEITYTEFAYWGSAFHKTSQLEIDSSILMTAALAFPCSREKGLTPAGVLLTLFRDDQCAIGPVLDLIESRRGIPIREPIEDRLNRLVCKGSAPKGLNSAA